MRRDEWYKHRTMDHIERVAEYVEIMMDGAMDSDLNKDDAQMIYHYLCVLQADISKQLNKG